MISSLHFLSVHFSDSIQFSKCRSTIMNPPLPTTATYIENSLSLMHLMRFTKPECRAFDMHFSWPESKELIRKKVHKHAHARFCIFHTWTKSKYGKISDRLNQNTLFANGSNVRIRLGLIENHVARIQSVVCIRFIRIWLNNLRS